MTSIISLRGNSLTCDICGSVESIPLYGKGRWGLEVPNVICKGCGLIYVDPQEFEKPYRDELPSMETGKEVAEVWGDILDIHEPATILDVGCGVRGVGEYFREDGSCVIAIDPDPEAIKVSKAKYPYIFHLCTPFEGFEGFGKFNYIFLIHTLEHLRSPKSALLKAWELLFWGGKLAIEVPCVERLYDLPECKEFDGHGLNFFFQKPHLYTFSLKTLSSLLNMTGFMGVRWDFGNHLRCVATKSATNNDIEREDAEIVKNRLLGWHERRQDG